MHTSVDQSNWSLTSCVVDASEQMHRALELVDQGTENPDNPADYHRLKALSIAYGAGLERAAFVTPF